jgi:hypothetical protein
MLFFVGLHQPSDCRHFERSFVSVNRLRQRKSDFPAREWIMDSGAFTEISTHGDYRSTVAEYAAQIERWKSVGNMRAAVAQDWMCEPWIIEKTGKSVMEHQRLTVERYDALQPLTQAYVMPVLQGFQIGDYLRHVESYGSRLVVGAWVGVGSVCKRNGDPAQIEDILLAIKRERPDLRLHGFGLKTTALASAAVCDMLYSADSMAWSFAARKQGRNANDWREAARFVCDIENRPKQMSLCF